MLKSKLDSQNRLSNQELENLQEEQIAGIEPRTVNGNVDPSYQVPDYEQHIMHVQMELPEYDQTTGQRKSTPYVQKFYVKEFEQIESVSGFAGYKVDVLHDPTRTSATPVGMVSQVIEEVGKLGNNKASLQAKYKELYGEAPSDDLTVVELKADIKLRQDYLADV